MTSTTGARSPSTASDPTHSFLPGVGAVPIESTSPQLPSDPLATDGWLGTPEFPGYRANNVVVRLDHEPQVDPEHLYFHLLLLDANGQLQDNHSGPCLALARHQSLPERIRFVRVVAELVRFAPNEERGLSGIRQALTLVRESGVNHSSLVVVAQVFDDICSEEIVTTSLIRLLNLSLGVHDAPRAIHDVAIGLARRSGSDADAASLGILPTDVHSKAMPPKNASSLHAQMSYIVRTVGKLHARRYLRDLVGSELVPLPHMLGV